MQQTDYQTIKKSHNLFLHKFIDNQQPKSVNLMRLDSHTTLFREGSQNKYLTNLVIAGRNYIQVLAIFQNQITLNMGTWYVYEDIIQVQQWDKNIVISTKNKIIGLIYEDCIIKNSFMLSLQFLELGFREQIQTVCDRTGLYMLVATTRQILICVSQKAINKYKAKPFSHIKFAIIQQQIKWNRSDNQNIADVIKFQYYQFQLSKVQCFHFCDQFLYFIGYTGKFNNQKFVYELPMFQIFSDNNKHPLILKFIKLENQIKQSYPIRKEHQTQFFDIKIDNSLYLRNQKGQIIIQNQLFKDSVPTPQKYLNQSQNRILCRKNNNPLIFPLQVFYKNTVHIYQRPPVSSSSISRRSIKLPESVQVQYCDIQDNLFVYCNLYEVGLIYLKNPASLSSSRQGVMIDQNQDKQKMQLPRIILKQSFGRIVDFSIGQNLIIAQNTFNKKCQLRILRKGIIQNSKTLITHPKKIALDQIPYLKSIRSLIQLLTQYQVLQSQNQIKRIRTFLTNYLIIQTKNDTNHLYKLAGTNKYQQILTQFNYYTIIKNNISQTQTQMNQHNQVVDLQHNSWYLLLWSFQKQLSYYKIQINIQNPSLSSLKLHKKLYNVQLWKDRTKTIQIRKIKQYLISIYEHDICLGLFKWNTGALSVVNMQRQAKQAKNLNHTIMRINYKSITFKKKDKDFFFLEVILLIDCQRLKIVELEMQSGLFKLSHTTQNVGQGLAILLPRQSAALNTNINLACHQLRAITCPQYVLLDKGTSNYFSKTPIVLKMHTYQYQAQSFLFIINQKQQLQLYKKYYCTGTANSTFGSIDTGYLYYRQPIQLNIIKKFKYNQSLAFTSIGCGILRICNLVFYKGQLMQFPQNIRTCFQIQGQTWSIYNDNKIKVLQTAGRVISHYLTIDIASQIRQQIVGLQSTNQNYIIYSRQSFQIFDKQLKTVWKLNLNDICVGTTKQYLLTICAYDHYLAVSYYNYFQTITNTQQSISKNRENLGVQAQRQYQSIRFKVRIYNIITKKKIIEKQIPFQQPILHMRYIAPDKLVLVTSSSISINIIKNNQTLENYKNKYYSKRCMLSCFSYVPEKVGVEPGYMIFGGLYGGLDFYVGQWIEKDKLDQIWFENLKCGITQAQIFHYGGQLEVLKALVADDSENIIVLDLKPKCGEKIADFHIGSPVLSLKKRYQIPYIATADGCIRMLLPIKLKDPQITFLDFQKEICKGIPMLAGFNNRDSRLLDQRKKTYKITSTGNIVDGEIIRSFLSLSDALKNTVYENFDLALEDLKSQLLAQI